MMLKQWSYIDYSSLELSQFQEFKQRSNKANKDERLLTKLLDIVPRVIASIKDNLEGTQGCRDSIYVFSEQVEINTLQRFQIKDLFLKENFS